MFSCSSSLSLQLSWTIVKQPEIRHPVRISFNALWLSLYWRFLTQERLHTSVYIFSCNLKDSFMLWCTALLDRLSCFPIFLLFDFSIAYQVPLGSEMAAGFEFLHIIHNCLHTTCIFIGILCTFLLISIYEFPFLDQYFNVTFSFVF